MPFVAPCRCCRFERLLRWMVGEKFARRCEPKIFVRRFANEKFEKTRAFEPPMPKQFRVKWYDNDRSGDAMIFYAGEFPGSARNRPEMVHRKIETDIPIEFPVGWIARITFLRAPNLPARIAVARENGRSRWRVTRRINRALWPRL